MTTTRAKKVLSGEVRIDGEVHYTWSATRIGLPTEVNEYDVEVTMKGGQTVEGVLAHDFKHGRLSLAAAVMDWASTRRFGPPPKVDPLGLAGSA